MIRRIDRYLAVEILGPFLTAVGFLFMLLFAMQLLRGIDVMFGSAVRAGDLGRIAAFLAPHFLVMAMPVSYLFAVMLAVGRWSEDRETIALSASGVRPWRLWGAPVALGLLISLLGVALSVGPDPRGLAALRTHVKELIKRNVAGDVKPAVFYDALNNIILYAQGVAPESQRFSNVLIADERDPDAAMLVLAHEGRIEPQGAGGTLGLTLRDGEIHRSSSASSDYAVVTFEKALMTIPVERDLLNKKWLGAAREELTPAELEEAAARAEAEGNLREARSFRVAKAKRVAQPLASAAFALCAVPLALGRRRQSRALGALATLVAYIGYYVLARAGDTLGETGRLPEVLAAQLPNLAFVALGVILIRRATRAE